MGRQAPKSRAQAKKGSKGQGPSRRAPASQARDEPESSAAKLFDLRVLIGSLFTLYGVVLIVAGAFVSSAELRKASNVNINLWMGIGMLALGVAFLAWWRLKPQATRTR